MSKPVPPPPSTTPTNTSQPPTQPSPHPAHTIVPPTPENIERIISIISGAFVHTPLMISFFSELNNFSTSTPHSAINRQSCLSYYAEGITRVSTSGGILAESGDFAAIAVWEPPSYAAADFTSGRKRWGDMSREWTARVKAARIKYLGLPGENPAVEHVTHTTETRLRPFWHLGFLARDVEREKVGGAVSAVVLPFLGRAREEGVPAWLEATGLRLVEMYTHYGFGLVEVITCGKGVYGADGWPREGGEGASGYCMIYDAHLREKEG